ncbi:hypothetical protein CROQUDRAFT_94533 [Cronartium quercuum f. sp. fusiforme G11]|uniref:Uncharacterized protein n=1 Tax=Cronartium quercuum f. sp. fusiforme G11 TaxID=708437 RepID=A0A9P6NIX2_9BASI|nr:hypothetical protein CROQUDRAFT_94533 [Cronartium quercuum f. sp. fusiforme G11]
MLRGTNGERVRMSCLTTRPMRNFHRSTRPPVVAQAQNWWNYQHTDSDPALQDQIRATIYDFFSTTINPLPPSTHNSDEEGDQTIFNISSLLNPNLPEISQNAVSGMATTSPNPFGASKQQQALHLNQALSKIGPNSLLTDENYISWASEVRVGLDSLYLTDYLKSDETKMEEDNQSVHQEVARMCIVAWLLHQMDPANRARFEPKITTYSDIGPEIQDLPAKLWKEVLVERGTNSLTVNAEVMGSSPIWTKFFVEQAPNLSMCSN